MQRIFLHFRMGYYANNFKTTGSFYLSTTAEAPFCANQYLFEMTVSENSPKTAGEITLKLGSETSTISVIP